MWLNPINSYKHMSALEISIVEDVVTADLVCDKYASRNPTHIGTLRELFSSHGLFVPKLVDINTELRPRCLEFAKSVGLIHEPAFAFLTQHSDPSNTVGGGGGGGGDGVRVYVSTVESPGRFYVQLYQFYKNLENVNSEIESYLARMNADKKKGKFWF